MPARRFVVIGLGSFGFGMAEALYRLGHEVIALDLDDDRVQEATEHATRAVAADGTDPETLDRLGGGEADAGVVSVGTDMAASVLAVMALQDVGVSEVYAKAITDEHATILERVGALEVIRPERETAFRLAARLAQRVLSYMPVAPGYSMEEIAVPDEFIGMTLVDLQLPQRFGIAIVAIHDVLADELHVVPSPDYLLKESDTIWIIGGDDALREISNGED